MSTSQALLNMKLKQAFTRTDKILSLTEKMLKKVTGSRADTLNSKMKKLKQGYPKAKANILAKLPGKGTFTLKGRTKSTLGYRLIKNILKLSESVVGLYIQQSKKEFDVDLDKGDYNGVNSFFRENINALLFWLVPYGFIAAILFGKNIKQYVTQVTDDSLRVLDLWIDSLNIILQSKKENLKRNLARAKRNMEMAKDKAGHITKNLNNIKNVSKKELNRMKKERKNS